MKIKKINYFVFIMWMFLLLWTTFANDYDCMRWNNWKDFDLNSPSFVMTDKVDTFSCDKRMNYKKIYAGDWNDTLTWIDLSVWSIFYLWNGDDTFSTNPINYENRSKYVFQKDTIDGGPWNDTLNIDNIYSSEVSISGDCSKVCTLYSVFPWFNDIRLISIEKIKFKDKEETFPKSVFKYTIVPRWNKLMRYDLSNRWPIKFVDTNEDGKNDTVVETDVWNINSAEGYIDVYYDKAGDFFYFDTNLKKIIPKNNAWTYGDPNIYKWNKPRTWTGTLNILPVKISNISKLNVSFNYQIENDNTPMNFYNEGYITKNKIELNGPQNGDFEFMILWYHFIDTAPGNIIWTATIPVKINGKVENLKFNIYTDNDLWRQTFINFVPINYNKLEWSISYNIADFIKVIEKYYPYVKNMYLEDWHVWDEFGGKVNYAKFRTKIENYNIELISNKSEINYKKKNLSSYKYLIPAYWWSYKLNKDLLKLQKKSSIVIVNSNNWNVSSPEDVFKDEINKIHQNDNLAIWYIYSNYAKEPVYKIEKYIDNRLKYYPNIDWFFIDGVSSSKNDLNFYRKIYEYIKRKNKNLLVVLNPWITPDKSYFDIADNIVVYENKCSNYLTYKQPYWLDTLSWDRISYLWYDCTTWQKRILYSRFRNNLKYFTIDGKDWNPWDSFDLPNKKTILFKYVNFFGNTKLKLFIPFSSGYQLTWGYGYGNLVWLWDISTGSLKNKYNTCYIPSIKFWLDFASNLSGLNVTIGKWKIKLNWSQSYNINVKYLWGYFWVSMTWWFETKVTSEVKIWNKYYPVWDFNDPITSNVNDGTKQINIKNVKNISLSIISQVWDMKKRYSNWQLIPCKEINLYTGDWYQVGRDVYGRCYYRLVYYHIPKFVNNLDNWYKYKLIEWDKDTDNVIVLKNGDSINKILSNYDQTVTWQPWIGKYIKSYVKNGKIVIRKNQFLYLFEFNNINQCKKKHNCDYQDSVILITITPNNNLGNKTTQNKDSMNYKYGVYYNCSYNKWSVINDVCSEISKNIVNSNKIWYAFQFDKNWKNMIKFASKNYIFLFKDKLDLYSFYEIYCSKPRLDVSLVNLYKLINNLRESMQFKLSNLLRKRKLPPYVKINKKASTIIFDFAKNYELKR